MAQFSIDQDRVDRFRREAEAANEVVLNIGRELRSDREEKHKIELGIAYRARNDPHNAAATDSEKKRIEELAAKIEKLRKEEELAQMRWQNLGRVRHSVVAFAEKATPDGKMTVRALPGPPTSYKW